MKKLIKSVSMFTCFLFIFVYTSVSGTKVIHAATGEILVLSYSMNYSTYTKKLSIKIDLAANKKDTGASFSDLTGLKVRFPSLNMTVDMFSSGSPVWGGNKKTFTRIVAITSQSYMNGRGYGGVYFGLAAGTYYGSIEVSTRPNVIPKGCGCSFIVPKV